MLLDMVESAIAQNLWVSS